MIPSVGAIPAAGLAILLSSTAARATEYHVAPGGDDRADGSALRPFRTIQRAADVVAAGDVVEVSAGDYAGFDVEDKDGATGRPIVFRGASGVRITAPGPVPRRPPLNTALRSRTWPRWPNGIEVIRSRQVVIEGFTVVGMPDAVPGVQRGGAGIRLDSCRFVTVRRNRVDDNGRWGIFSAFCDDLVVEENEASRSHAEHGIYLSNSGDRPVVRGNQAWGNSLCGIQLNGDNDWDDVDYRRWAYPDGLIAHATIVDNVLRDNGRKGGAAINLDGVVDSLIASNVIEGNHASGIALFQDDGRTASQRDWIMGNTISMPADGRNALQIVGCEAGNTANGLCVDANEPYLPEWRRPPAFATGSTGHVILSNVLVQENPLAAAIHVDTSSLAVDPVSGRALVSDFNRVTPRFEIDGEMLDLAGWRARTGRDGDSVAVGR